MAVDIWPLVRGERLALADDVSGLTDEQWHTPSLCEGWLVRDVVAHLAWIAEGSYRKMVREGLRHPGTINSTMAKVARDQKLLPTDSLAGRLRAAAGGRFKAPTLPPAVALAEVIIHGEDAFRPLGRRRSVGSEGLGECLDLYGRIGWVISRNRRARKVRFEATDLDWSHGAGPEVRGPAVSLLMAMGGRTGVLDGLEGPGVAILR